ncbi:Dam family site-specific DNA-(adenine-N6)-methyltransferase [Cyanobium sp. BA5m-10]|uniref:DNA adenine methylase n=1 Tax=Cyanobium sp. BA5m-10 TaxID=2823705 RepID=UPI0020CBF287|nr:Dam family site-specific DNA-(adenine-N6)-methyltransferase [Cyanobium sp. BA5m-10]MCP9905390.1 Dam family site-specific DNA-(adenine-N6)-methyltransferase [Cyanobium sp. BA5m-10]
MKSLSSPAQLLFPGIETPRSSPFLKWAGGKGALLKDLRPLVPAGCSVFFEPFVGGGSFMFEFSEGREYHMYDANNWLIDTYTAVAKNWEYVAEIIDTMPCSRDHFLKVRAVHPDSVESIYEKAANLIYLNKTCFRGLFRVNKKGFFNVPYGNYDRRVYDPELLKACSVALGKIHTISCQDYRRSLASVKPGSFVYLDPPYFKAGGYSDFNRYTASKFELGDQIELAAICNELSERGVKWLLSNSDTTTIKCLYSGYRVVEVDARREINLSSQNRDIKELVIMNYNPHD